MQFVKRAELKKCKKDTIAKAEKNNWQKKDSYSNLTVSQKRLAQLYDHELACKSIDDEYKLFGILDNMFIIMGDLMDISQTLATDKKWMKEFNQATRKIKKSRAYEELMQMASEDNKKSADRMKALSGGDSGNNQAMKETMTEAVKNLSKVMP